MASLPQKKRLGDILIEGGAITEDQLLTALEVQKRLGKKLGEVLVSEKIISDSKLAEVLSTQLKIPLISLARYRPSVAALKLVPQHIAERFLVIPLSILEDGAVMVTMSDPLDIIVQDELQMMMRAKVKPCVSPTSDIKDNIERIYSFQDALEGAIVEVYRDGIASQTETLLSGVGAQEAPVIQLVSNVLEQAVQEGASDVHVEPFEKESRIRYRVDGKLYSAHDFPADLHTSLVSRLKILSGMDIAEKRKPQDGRILVRIAGRRIDLRVSSLPAIHGEKIVLRILDTENAMVGLNRLGIDNEGKEKIRQFCELPWGFILVTGPTGSGKSTTLYSMLEILNKPDVNIISVEDPVEYTMEGINQIQVNDRAGLSFESALRSILRQDPDKIMVGEIRDFETAQLAIRAALTGHMVLSTLHTNDAPSAIARLADMKIPSFLLSSSIVGVIAQRLVRMLCPKCKEQYRITLDVCEQLGIPAGSSGWRAVGCADCRGAGYRGRQGVYEIMAINDEIRSMILKGISGEELHDAAVRNGMVTLRKAGLLKALAGDTTIEEVISATI